MSRVEFDRFDVDVQISRAAGEIAARVSLLGPSGDALGPARQITLGTRPLEAAARAATGLGLGESWQALQQHAIAVPSAANRQRIERLTVETHEADIAALPWESILRPDLGAPEWAAPIIRRSPVSPAAADVPMTLPARILQVDPAPGRALVPLVRALFGSHPDSEVEAAVLVRVTPSSGLGEVAPFQWPTVEVLHLDALPSLPPGVGRQSAAAVDTVGTLGWLARRTAAWQTRLVVLHCDSPDDAAEARRLACRVIDRGGPAVLVIEALAGAAPHGFYAAFYDRLVHDDPLDVALRNMSAAPGIRPSLFVGAGGEELLRVSTLGIRLLDLEASLSAPIPLETAPEVDITSPRYQIQSAIAHSAASEDVGPRLDAVSHELRNLSREWETVQFEFHEGEGLLPLSRRLTAVRQAARISGPAAVPPRPAPAERFVNADFRRAGRGGEPTLLPQDSTHLTVGEQYLLRVQIGGRDPRLRVIGATALIEEFFNWSPNVEGVWLEVAVTGLDFDVVGDPVRELWLPRGGTSEAVEFVVVPRTDRVARLRFCLYYRENVIHSYRIAALTVPTTPPHRPSRRAVAGRSRLARALGVATRVVPDVGYLTRLEYCATADLDRSRQRPPRALSITANDLDGRPVVTLKGKDLFAVETNNDLPDLVADVRRALHEISTPPREGVAPEDWPYGFGQPGQPNAGTLDGLTSALEKLAIAGWAVFDAIVPGSERERLAEILAAPGQTIQVAHVLLEKVIPWNCLYDRLYDENQKIDEAGHPVSHDVCLASLPDAQGKLPGGPCGSLPACPLHPDHVSAALTAGRPVPVERTVVCPRSFWGFKHIIEIPAQQASVVAGATGPTAGRRPPDIREKVLRGAGSTQLLAGINEHCLLVKQHLSELDDVVARSAAAATWRPKVTRRDPMLVALQSRDLDVIYFYCHARGGLADPGVKPPCLELHDLTVLAPERINATHLYHKQAWDHYPLVILNGCGTVGFSPDALSPFVIRFVRDRGAAGVLGTEIPVWEQLATAVARDFLRRFLAGEGAGPALLAVRRELLAERNPLGLVYTLYAPAELALQLT